MLIKKNSSKRDKSFTKSGAEVAEDVVVDDTSVEDVTVEDDSVTEEQAAQSEGVEDIVEDVVAEHTVETETQELPAPEEKPAESTPVEEPVKDIRVASGLTGVTLDDIVRSDKLSDEEKIAEILKGKFAIKYKGAVSKLKIYNDTVVDVGDPKKIANMGHDIYLVLKSLLNVEQYTEFKLNLDLINIVFRAYGKQKLNVYNLHRELEKWPAGFDETQEHSILVTIITKLAVFSTRATNIKSIDFNGDLFNNGLFSFSPQAKSNFKRYYGVN